MCQPKPTAPQEPELAPAEKTHTPFAAQQEPDVTQKEPEASQQALDAADEVLIGDNAWWSDDASDLRELGRAQTVAVKSQLVPDEFVRLFSCASRFADDTLRQPVLLRDVTDNKWASESWTKRGLLQKHGDKLVWRGTEQCTLRNALQRLARRQTSSQQVTGLGLWTGAELGESWDRYRGELTPHLRCGKQH